LKTYGERYESIRFDLVEVYKDEIVHVKDIHP